MRCLDCTHLSLKQAGDMGLLGFGLCLAQPELRSTYFGATKERECAKHEQAEDKTIAARRKALERSGIAVKEPG